MTNQLRYEDIDEVCLKMDKKRKISHIFDETEHFNNKKSWFLREENVL